MEFVEPIRDKEKIEAMKNYFKASNYRDYVLFVIGINTALRVSDLLRLKVSTVKQHRLKNFREKKTGDMRTARFPQYVNEIIDGYIKGKAPDDWLFPDDDYKGRPISRYQAYRLINKAGQAVGIEDNLGTHSLRKTWAYHKYKAGWSLDAIMLALNHDSISDTKRYIGLTMDEMNEIFEEGI